MLADLKHDGFRVSCWQLPYFVPKNKLFPELVEKNLVVRDAKGNLPYEDAVLDFSNPQTIEWYQGKLASVLKMGVGAIKVDFTMSTSRRGIFAAGDIASFPGKLKLIATGFAEACVAVNYAKHYLDPSANVFPGHTSNMKL